MKLKRFQPKKQTVATRFRSKTHDKRRRTVFLYLPLLSNKYTFLKSTSIDHTATIVAGIISGFLVMVFVLVFLM